MPKCKAKLAHAAICNFIPMPLDISTLGSTHPDICAGRGGGTSSIIKLHFASQVIVQKQQPGHCAEATNVPWCQNSTTRLIWEIFAASQSLCRMWLLHNVYRTWGEQLKTAANPKKNGCSKTAPHKLISRYQTTAYPREKSIIYKHAVQPGCDSTATGTSQQAWTEPPQALPHEGDHPSVVGCGEDPSTSNINAGVKTRRRLQNNGTIAPTHTRQVTYAQQPASLFSWQTKPQQVMMGAPDHHQQRSHPPHDHPRLLLLVEQRLRCCWCWGAGNAAASLLP